MATSQDERLHQHSWQLIEIGPLAALQAIPTAFTITLQFEELRVHGQGACNRYFATYDLDGPHLHFHAAAATRMMCPEPAMTLENAYFAALASIETYQLQENQLILYFDQGKSLLRFHPSVNNPTEQA